MERADNVVVLEGFRLELMGSPDALGGLYPPDENGNQRFGEQVSLDTAECISYIAKDKADRVDRREDLIVVEGRNHPGL